MNRIKTFRRLREALAQYQALQARRSVLEAHIESLRRQIVSWYERNNRTQFIDKDGNVWRKLQGSTVIYDDDGLKKLLKKKGIDPEDVYHVEEIEVRDEQAIAKLLREKKIKVKEWKKYATIHYHSSYVRRFDPPKVKDGSK